MKRHVPAVIIISYFLEVEKIYAAYIRKIWRMVPFYMSMVRGFGHLALLNRLGSAGCHVLATAAGWPIFTL